MSNTNELRDVARNTAAAHMFSIMASEEKSNALLEELRALPDDALNVMAKLSGVPEGQLDIHNAMVRGHKNAFTDELENVDGLLKTGDIILMTGNSLSSQALAKSQMAIYSRALSSHVALVHADFICIDAMPKNGTSNRIISEVLTDVEPNWRVIRFKSLQSKNLDSITRACVYYLAQPYKILPTKKPMKGFSYCSELARKVYNNSGITGTGIPNNFIVKPANFDQLANENPNWLDVTDRVRPAIDFCTKYPELVKIASKLFIDGLKLNRERFKQRTTILTQAQKAAKAGIISRDKLLEITREIKGAEENLNHKFWDVPKRD